MITFNSKGIDFTNSGLIGWSTNQNTNLQSSSVGNLYNTLNKNPSAKNLYDTLFKNSSSSAQESSISKGIQNNNSLNSSQTKETKSEGLVDGLFSTDGRYLYGGLSLNNLSNSNMLFGNYSSVANSLQGLQTIGNFKAIQSYTLLKNIPLFQKGLLIDGFF